MVDNLNDGDLFALRELLNKMSAEELLGLRTEVHKRLDDIGFFYSRRIV